jgi:hypothetical protein
LMCSQIWMVHYLLILLFRGISLMGKQQFETDKVRFLKRIKSWNFGCRSKSHLGSTIVLIFRKQKNVYDFFANKVAIIMKLQTYINPTLNFTFGLFHSIKEVPQCGYRFTTSSPADDFIELTIDLNKIHQEPGFYLFLP